MFFTLLLSCSAAFFNFPDIFSGPEFNDSAKENKFRSLNGGPYVALYSKCTVNEPEENSILKIINVNCFHNFWMTNFYN